MNHIVFDLELNTAFNAGLKPGNLINKNCPNEILEVGAVKLDDNYTVIDKFQSLVRPTIYKKLSPIVKKKTGITYKSVYEGKRFNQVFRSFMEWVGDDDCVLYSWGSGDVLDLKRNCRCHKIKVSKIFDFIDLQDEFRKKMGFGKGINYSLKKALEVMNIKADENFHRALNDAEYTAEILVKLVTIKDDTALIPSVTI